MARAIQLPVCVLALAYGTPLDPDALPGGGALAPDAHAQAAQVIARDDLFAAGASAAEIAAATVPVFLERHDPYGAFLTPADYAAFQRTGGPAYAGIGMELERTRDGRILCYPLAGGPAAAAGIAPGERLVAIDGAPVQGKSLAALAVRMADAAGTKVTLDTVALDGGARRRTLTRATIDAATVTTDAHGALPILRIATFGPATRRELVEQLAAWRPGAPIVIDLRGNGGGDFHAAVDAAMLFLKHGAAIVSVQRRAGSRAYVNTYDGPPFVQAVFLWQDGSTASAAEVFAAALAENGRAVTIGATSAGKGTLQEIVPLDDGAALVLTTAYLATPHGARFDGRGLAPMRPLPAGATTADYARQVSALEK